jgi:hypothetical protein
VFDVCAQLQLTLDLQARAIQLIVMADVIAAKLLELNVQERKLRADILRDQRRISRKNKRELAGGFTDFEITFALRVYVLDSFCTIASVTWLAQQQSQRQ